MIVDKITALLDGLNSEELDRLPPARRRKFSELCYHWHQLAERRQEQPMRQNQPPPPSHPAAQALLAGLLQGMGEREQDAAMADAGQRLAEAAQKGQPAAPRGRWRADWLWTFLGLGKRWRAS
jgi:hypothetical protein